MTDETRDLLAGEALDALSREDAERLERELAADPSLARERDAYRATVASLDSGVAREQPPDGLFDRILGEIDEGSVPHAQPEPSPPTRRRRSWVPRLALAGAAAALVVAVALAALDGSDAPDARADVAGTEEFPDVRGVAELFSPTTAGGSLVLELENLPPPPVGSHYEVWVLREEAGEAMEAVGSFTPTGGTAELDLPLPGPGDFQAVDVSVEPDGGSPAHSGVSLAGGSFEVT